MIVTMVWICVAFMVMWKRNFTVAVLTLMFMTIVMHGNKISFDAVVLYMMIKVKVIQAQIGQ